MKTVKVHDSAEINAVLQFNINRCLIDFNIYPTLVSENLCTYIQSFIAWPNLSIRGSTAVQIFFLAVFKIKRTTTVYVSAM